jgi:hypothetical protein
MEYEENGMEDTELERADNPVDVVVNLPDDSRFVMARWSLTGC